MSDIFFEGLDISDDDGANVDASAGSSSAPAANGKLSREQRLARAFQNSKDTWRPEHGLTESGVSVLASCRFSSLLTLHYGRSGI